MKMKNTSGGGLTFKCRVHFGRGGQGRMKLHAGPPPQTLSAATGRIPRVSRLMALAIHFDSLLRRGEVKDYADLARLGHVTRARVTQVMNLLCLCPQIQEQILFWPLVTSGYDPLKEWEVRPIAAEPVWGRQRRMWRTLVREGSASVCARPTCSCG